MMTKSFSYYMGRVLFWLVIVGVAIYLLFPFYWAVNSSLKTENQRWPEPVV